MCVCVCVFMRQFRAYASIPSPRVKHSRPAGQSVPFKLVRMVHVCLCMFVWVFGPSVRLNSYFPLVRFRPVDRRAVSHAVSESQQKTLGIIMNSGVARRYNFRMNFAQKDLSTLTLIIGFGSVLVPPVVGRFERDV